MCNGRHQGYRRCLILAAIVALTGSQGAAAGLYTMEQTLADFTFDDASIVYRRDSHTPGAKADDGEDARAGASSSLGQTAQSYGKGDGLRGVMVLNAGQNIENDLVRGPFNVFGSFPSASSHSNVTRLTEALEKLGSTKKADSDLAFMNEKDRLSGALATKYRGYGVYFSVGGIDQLTWINEMKKAIAKGGDIIELSAESETAPLATSARAIPAPGSLALVLVGCLGIAALGTLKGKNV